MEFEKITSDKYQDYLVLVLETTDFVTENVLQVKGMEFLKGIKWLMKRCYWLHNGKCTHAWDIKTESLSFSSMDFH